MDTLKFSVISSESSLVSNKRENVNIRILFPFITSKLVDFHHCVMFGAKAKIIFEFGFVGNFKKCFIIKFDLFCSEGKFVQVTLWNLSIRQIQFCNFVDCFNLPTN